MTKLKYIPQLIFTDTIKAKNSELQWGANYVSVKRQAKQFARIIRKIKQARGIIHLWFKAEDSIMFRDFMTIENQLEKQLQPIFGARWEVEVILVPVNKEMDFENILEAVEQQIRKLVVRFPFAILTQIVSDGDVLLSQAITLEGVKQFEDRYANLYWDAEQIIIRQIPVQKNVQDWRSQFRDFVVDHDYQAAFELLSDLAENEITDILKSLLQMMIKRLNFSFDEALFYLEETKKQLSAHDVYNETHFILTSLQSPDKKARELARIVELYRQLEIYFEKEDYPSFLVRFYRAREAILYYLLQHGQQDSAIVKLKAKSSIYEVIDQLEEKYESEKIIQYYGTYFYLKSKNVADMLRVRNNSFIGHGRKEINHKDLLIAHYGTARTTAVKAKRRFLVDSLLMLKDLEAELDDNFEHIIRLLLSISRNLEVKQDEKRNHFSVES